MVINWRSCSIAVQRGKFRVVADKWDGYKEKGNPFLIRNFYDLVRDENAPSKIAPIIRANISRRIRFQISNAFFDLKDSAVATLSHEIGTGTPFNLVPVGIGTGVLAYFAAPQEPSLLALLILFFVFAIFSFRLRYHGFFYYSLVSLLVIIGGMVAAKMSTIRSYTPQLERQITAKIGGVVIAVDKNTRGAPRYLIKPSWIEGLQIKQIPRRIRLSAQSRHQRILPGRKIAGLARMQPVSGPAYPGGYDFSFHSWFEGIGGTGFFMGAPSSSGFDSALGFQEQFAVSINLARLYIEGRILQSLPGVPGSIVIALITGNRSGIPNETQESLRISGLAHILAISGLHMALVTLTVIWILRLACSCIPSIVLFYPVKKWVAGAGFLTATLYLFLSGAGTATQRAWIMVSVMLLAVLLDRRAITMRSVAISATAILIISPQSLLSPGFQMSFAAVTALVASYEALNKRKREIAENSKNTKPVFAMFLPAALLVKYISGIALTSLIAGLATGLIAAWHFHRVAIYGLLGNILAMPIVTLATMPLALFSILLMPLGYEHLALEPLSYSIEQVLKISIWVEGLSPDGSVGIQPKLFLFLGVVGLGFLTLFKTRIRLLGIALVMAMPLATGNKIVPDILISENGRAIAIANSSGENRLLYPTRNNFVSDIWLKAWGGKRERPADIDDNSCTRDRCIATLNSGEDLHVVYDPKLLKDSCNRASILVAPRLWWVNCRSNKPDIILKRWDFEQHGTHGIYLPNNKPADIGNNIIRVETALSFPVRPWHRRVGEVKTLSDIVGSSQQVSPVP